MTEVAKLKSAFLIHSGLFQFKLIPYGLINDPSTSEQLMATVLHGLQWQICFVYTDDMINFSRTVAKHVSWLETLLHKLERG